MRAYLIGHKDALCTAASFSLTPLRNPLLTVLLCSSTALLTICHYLCISPSAPWEHRPYLVCPPPNLHPLVWHNVLWSTYYYLHFTEDETRIQPQMWVVEYQWKLIQVCLIPKPCSQPLCCPWLNWWSSLSWCIWFFVCLFVCLFWLHHTAHGILGPWPGIEPLSPALEVGREP